jgi:hypothetical protein
VLAARLQSYRFRRKLLWLGLSAVAIGVATTVSIVFWNTGPLRTERFSGGAAQVYTAPAESRLTAADQRAIMAIAKQFVATAVTRDDPGSAFELAGPSLRTGTTRAGWETGEIPVVPFPVDTARWRVDYSVENEVGLEVYAWPEPDAGLRPTLFLMSLVAVGSGEGRHWLVESWVPRGGRPDVLRQRVSNQTPLQAALAEQNQSRVSRSMSAAWLLALPAALVGMLVAVPAWVILRNRRFARRAARS